ncbi:MAG: M20/M25/M40 family metallo-hydrolase [Verrucomicrobiota bacterium]
MPTKTEKLLKQLIAIPSVNPDGDPGTEHTGEKVIAQFLAEYLKALGAKVKLTNVEKDRPNLFARFPVKGKVKQRILFAPHSDTVSVAGMTISPFKPTVKGGKIYGRGASDTKGPMAAMLTALAEVTATPEYQNGETEFTFAAFMGEETGCIGATAFAQTKEAKRYDLAIIGEPTSFKMVHAHKGCIWAKVTIPGRAAHASIADPAQNANLKMGRVLRAIENDFLPWLENFPHPVLGLTTASPNILSGGSKANISPQQTELTIDIRTTPKLPVSKLEKILKQILNQTGTGAKLSMPIAGTAMHTDPEHPLLQKIKPATRGFDTAPWFCDAAKLAEIGVPAIALGPGSIKQAHTKDEWIEVSDLNDGHQRFVKVMHRLLD